MRVALSSVHTLFLLNAVTPDEVTQPWPRVKLRLNALHNPQRRLILLRWPYLAPRKRTQEAA